jgi:hypothetical protein
MRDMEPRTESGFWTTCFGSSPRERWAATWFAVTCLAWAVSFVAAAAVLNRELVAARASWAVAAVPAVFAVATLLVCVRYLRELDELQRRVQLGALAFACGMTWVAIAAYPLFELVGAPKADSSSYMLVMVFSYMVGIIVAGVRYR